MNVQHFTVKYDAISDCGCIRKENQDNLYCVGQYRANISCDQQYSVRVLLGISESGIQCLILTEYSNDGGKSTKILYKVD